MLMRGESSVALDQGSVKRTVAVYLSQLAVDALVGKDGPPFPDASARMEMAARCYLGDRGSDRPAWPYPAFLRASETQEDVDLELRIDDELWGSFEEEAERQGISVQQMSEHAAFYLAAEEDAGRLTLRILDELESTATKSPEA
jgi:hypothetical protein